MKKYCLSLVFVLCIGGVIGQDLHFSQFGNAQLMVNPGFTGLIPGNMRFGLNYKQQWTGFGDGFTTYAFSYDQQINKKKWRNGWLGVGLNVFKDIAGDVQLSNTKGALSIAGAINPGQDRELSAGIQGGFAQYTMDPSKMMWDDQYNGVRYDPNIVSGDILTITPFYRGDFSAGIVYSMYEGETNIASYDEFSMKIGAAVHHINRPRLEWYGTEDRRYMKFVAHGQAFFGRKYTNTGLVPSFYAAFQGPSKDILVGLMYRIRFTEGSRFTGFIKEGALSVGGHFRYGDAIIPQMMLEFNNFAVALSYDVNVSQLQVASNFQGGLEVSLRFINPHAFQYKRKSSGTPML